MAKSKHIQKAERESLNIKDKLLEALKASTPEVFAEGKVNWDKVRLALGEHLDASSEKFNFTWAGKAGAVTNVLIPSQATLRPAEKESVKFDKSENIFIEGDNLEVLKLLQKSYFEQIKMIYIDPPYNTGNDFVYKDDFRQSLKNYLEQSGQVDSEGNRLSTNTQASGRFHSDWLTMMYPRLKLSWNLLRHDGAIFISIGQEELNNLITLCNEIFGEENRIGICVRVMKTGGNKGRFFSPNIEYLLIYAKTIEFITEFRDDLPQDLIDKVYTQIETTGAKKGEKYRLMGLYQPGLDERANQRYWIKAPDGTFVIPPGRTTPKPVANGVKTNPAKGDGVWRWTFDRYKTELKNNNIVFKKTGTSSLLDENGQQAKWNIYTKIWLNDRLESGRVPVDLIDRFENRHSSQEMKELGIPFEFAKPVNFISYLIKISGAHSDDIILDFFAGSGTTAHAVLATNQKEKHHRKFIMVQMPEQTDTKSEAYKAGFKTIADIAKERIRRVLKGYGDHKAIDDGFKVFKLGKSNYYDNLFEYDPDKSPEENDKAFKDYLNRSQKELFPDKINEVDIIYENIIKEGLSLNATIEEVKIGKNMAYKVSDAERELYISLDEKLSASAIEALTDKEYKEKIFICFDGALGDSDKANLALNVTLKTI